MRVLMISQLPVLSTGHRRIEYVFTKFSVGLRIDTKSHWLWLPLSALAAATSQPFRMRTDVCIATFKRPALLERLLRDLLAQQLPDGVSMHIIVVDNDVDESARPYHSIPDLLHVT
jgi:hypothetical protein